MAWAESRVTCPETTISATGPTPPPKTARQASRTRVRNQRRTTSPVDRVSGKFWQRRSGARRAWKGPSIRPGLAAGLWWSPPPESNRRPHPYHGTTRNRCADRRFPSSGSTVGAKVMSSPSAKGCAHFPVTLFARAQSSPPERIGRCPYPIHDRSFTSADGVSRRSSTGRRTTASPRCRLPGARPRLRPRRETARSLVLATRRQRRAARRGQGPNPVVHVPAPAIRR